jgi:hypothetical protein
MAQLITAPEAAFVVRNLEDKPIGVAPEEPNTLAKRLERIDHLGRKRTGDYVAAYDNRIHVLQASIGEYRLERGQVPVDVIERGDPHPTRLSLDT